MSVQNSPQPVTQAADTRRLTVFVLTQDWSGLHEMFEQESFEKMAGVPLVPMLWKVLADRGHDVHVFVVGAFSSQKDFPMAGFQVHRIHLPKIMHGAVKGRWLQSIIKVGWLWSLVQFYRAGKRVARRGPPDVVYSYRSGPALAAHLLAKRYGAVHIARRWGTWLAYNSKNLPWYRRIKDLGEVLSYKIPYDMMIMSNDGTLGEQAARELGYPLERHRFWLDGTSRDIYQPDLDIGQVKQSIGLSSDDKMIFGVARLDFWKRFDRAIDAMPAVLPRVPNAKLVIAGDGPLRADLQAQVDRLGVGDSVKFLGSVPHERVRQLHNAADIFITVQDLTNLGNQIMEAMHSRTCVVAHDVGGTRDVMTDGVTGLLLTEQQLPQLGERIADLLVDDARRKELADGAFQFAQEHIWFWDERTDAEIRLIHELVERKQRERHR